MMGDEPVPPLPSTASVPLNVIDLALRRVWRHLRMPDPPLNVHVNFRGRLDLSRLQDVADRLAVRWPLITARLTLSPRPAWVPTGAQRWPIRRQTLSSDSDADLLRAVYQLGENPFDLENEDPIRLIVLHQPGGNDVLTMQFSHTLMDAHGAVGLLQQLLDPTRIPPVSDTAAVPTDVLDQILAKTSFRDQMRALRRVIPLFTRIQPVTLPLLEQKEPTRRDGRVTLRWINETASTALQDRLERIGPFANPTFAVLASGCRTLSRYIRGPLGPRSAYVMWLGYNLRRGPQKRLLFQNLVSRFILVARPEQLGDRDQLTRLFASQARAQLADNTTVATLLLFKIFGKLDRWVPMWTRLLRPRPQSVQGGSIGEIFESGPSALGADVDYCWPSAPFIPLLGVSLYLLKSGRRLLAVFMHSPRNLSDEQASQFFDEWLEDLFRP